MKHEAVNFQEKFSLFTAQSAQKVQAGSTITAENDVRS